ncbi:MAG: shikimate kinase [Candidatus Cloacimonadales bacterium]
MQIYLIGFMGAGKSYLGRKLADYWQQDFYDLDLLLAAKYQRSVGEIFREKGEAGFRREESKLLLAWQKPGIIACGGGVIELEVNREYLKQQTVIWLDAKWPILWQRIKASARPLVLELGESGAKKLYEKRKDLYRSCTDSIIQSSEQTAANLEMLSREMHLICASEKV